MALLLRPRPRARRYQRLDVLEAALQRLHVPEPELPPQDVPFWMAAQGKPDVRAGALGASVLRYKIKSTSKAWEAPGGGSLPVAFGNCGDLMSLNPQLVHEVARGSPRPPAFLRGGLALARSPRGSEPFFQKLLPSASPLGHRPPKSGLPAPNSRILRGSELGQAVAGDARPADADAAGAVHDGGGAPAARGARRPGNATTETGCNRSPPLDTGEECTIPTKDSATHQWGQFAGWIARHQSQHCLRAH